MKEALRNLMDMNPQNLVMEVYVSLLVIWLMVVVATLWSIFAARMPGLLKAFWALLVVGVPLAGVFLYALFCVTRLDLRMLTARAQAARQLRARREAEAKMGLAA